MGILQGAAVSKLELWPVSQYFEACPLVNDPAETWCRIQYMMAKLVGYFAAECNSSLTSAIRFHDREWCFLAVCS